MSFASIEASTLIAFAQPNLSRPGAWPVAVTVGIWILAALAIYVVGSLLGAVWLRLAAWLGGLRDITFAMALKTMLVSNLAWGGIATIFLTPFMMALMNPPNGPYDRSLSLAFLSPTSLVPVVAGAILAHAVLFSHLLKEEEQPLPFGRSCFLSLLYLGVATLGNTVISLVVTTVYMTAITV